MYIKNRYINMDSSLMVLTITRWLIGFVHLFLQSAVFCSIIRAFTRMLVFLLFL